MGKKSKNSEKSKKNLRNHLFILKKNLETKKLSTKICKSGKIKKKSKKISKKKYENLKILKNPKPGKNPKKSKKNPQKCNKK